MPTIPQMFLDRVDQAGSQVSFFVPADRDPHSRGKPSTAHPGWNAYTFADCLGHVSGLACRLRALGVGTGVPVAILAETSHTWSAIDLATLCLGGITVGIYPTLMPDQVAYQLAHSEARVLVVEDQAQLDRLAGHLDEIDTLVHVLSMRPGDSAPPLTPAEPDPALLRTEAAKVQLDQVATYVYTSGTTGDPKGAILTHGNFDAVVRSSQQALPMQPGDRSIIFLPLAHSLQRMTLYRGLAEDAVGYYAPSIQALPETIQVARPHVLATVPRMLEKIKATAEAKAAARGDRAKGVFDRAFVAGIKAAQLRRQGQSLPFKLRAQLALYDRLVFRKVRAGMGGHLRLLVTGAAALSVDVADWFEALGIQVREGWGLTETCAPATTNRLDNYRLGTVGLPLPGVELALDTDGEVLVRGPGNFIGYFKNPQATAEAFNEEGYFRTGDLGQIDADGFLKIIDRKKELIVTAGGKNIPPVNIEKRVEGDMAGQVVVHGSERPFLVALIAPDEELLAALAQKSGWTGGFAQWSQAPEVRARIQAQVDRANATLARFEQVKKFDVLPAPLATATGELTPTLKLKRRVIRARYAERIEALYSG